MDDSPTEYASQPLWPLASSPDRTRWAAQAVERYLHMAWIILAQAATRPAGEAPFPPEVLARARQLYEAIARQVDALGRPPHPDVLCAHCGARPFFPYPVVPEEEAWPAICDPSRQHLPGRQRHREPAVGLGRHHLRLAMDALADTITAITLERAALVLGAGQLVYTVAPVVIPPSTVLVEGTVERGSWRGIIRGAS